MSYWDLNVHMKGCYHLFIRRLLSCDRRTQNLMLLHSCSILCWSRSDHNTTPVFSAPHLTKPDSILSHFLSIQDLSMEPKEPKYSVSLEEQDSEVSTAPPLHLNPEFSVVVNIRSIVNIYIYIFFYYLSVCPVFTLAGKRRHRRGQSITVSRKG